MDPRRLAEERKIEREFEAERKYRNENRKNAQFLRRLFVKHAPAKKENLVTRQDVVDGVTSRPREVLLRVLNYPNLIKDEDVYEFLHEKKLGQFRSKLFLAELLYTYFSNDKKNYGAKHEGIRSMILALKDPGADVRYAARYRSLGRTKR